MRGFARLSRSAWLASLLGLSVLIAARAQGAAADDWALFDDGRRHSLGLRVGDSESLTLGVDLQLMLPAASELSLSYLTTDYRIADSDVQLTDYRAEWTTNPLATWSAQLLYEQSGDRDSLETQDWGLGASYSGLSWTVGLGYLMGEARLRTDPLGNGAQRMRRSLDRRALDAHYSYFGERWQWRAAYRDYRYERSVSLSPTSLLLLRRLGINSFEQVFGLVDWSATLETRYQWQQHALRVGYSQQRLELTTQSGKTPYAGWDYTISEHMSIGLLAALGLEDAADYVEASLRLYW